jgi:hypothetical protein
MARWELLVLTAMFLIGAVMAFLLVSRYGRIKYKRESVQHNLYRGVSIRFSSNACDAAKRLADRRFLATEAPPLPLPECRATHCSCRYVYHADRRSGEDRRSGLESPLTMAGPNRRVGIGRRSSDKVA